MDEGASQNFTHPNTLQGQQNECGEILANIGSDADFGRRPPIADYDHPWGPSGWRLGASCKRGSLVFSFLSCVQFQSTQQIKPI